VGILTWVERASRTITVAPVPSTIRAVPSEVVLNEEEGMKFPCPVWLEWDSDLLNSVILTGTDHREEMICGAEGPAV